MGEKNLYRLYVDRTEDLPALRDQLRMATSSGLSDVLRRAGYDNLSQQARVTGILDGRCTRLTTEGHDAVYDYYRTVQDRRNYQGVVPDDVALLIAAIEDLRVFSVIEQRHSKNGEVIVVGIVRSTPQKGQPSELIADYVLAQWGPTIPTISTLTEGHQTKVMRRLRNCKRVIAGCYAVWLILTVLYLTVSKYFFAPTLPVLLCAHLTALVNMKLKGKKQVSVAGWILFVGGLVVMVAISATQAYPH